MSEPTGFEPKGSILLPSWRSTTTEVYAHVPTSWALEIFVWAIEAPESSPVKRHSSAAVATVSKRSTAVPLDRTAFGRLNRPNKDLQGPAGGNVGIHLGCRGAPGRKQD